MASSEAMVPTTPMMTAVNDRPYMAVVKSPNMTKRIVAVRKDADLGTQRTHRVHELLRDFVSTEPNLVERAISPGL